MYTNIMTYIIQTKKKDSYLTNYTCNRHEVGSNVNIVYVFAHYSSRRSYDRYKQ